MRTVVNSFFFNHTDGNTAPHVVFVFTRSRMLFDKENPPPKPLYETDDNGLIIESKEDQEKVAAMEKMNLEADERDARRAKAAESNPSRNTNTGGVRV